MRVKKDCAVLLERAGIPSRFVENFLGQSFERLSFETDSIIEGRFPASVIGCRELETIEIFLPKEAVE